MLFLDPKACLRIGDPEAVKAAIRAGLERLNSLAKGGGKVARALVLDGAARRGLGRADRQGLHQPGPGARAAAGGAGAAVRRRAGRGVMVFG
jgi:feruloyl-CoA synthase